MPRRGVHRTVRQHLAAPGRLHRERDASVRHVVADEDSRDVVEPSAPPQLAVPLALHQLHQVSLLQLTHRVVAQHLVAVAAHQQHNGHERDAHQRADEQCECDGEGLVDHDTQRHNALR
ncbi:hypothetical protein DQ04_22481000 [Trypanosoma grayi]|uniref:hypothetical protein n=1 Tax=Trypanosoma grayi TaxID=71804 RepID=UPI0004F41C90|nr:hypothetical protein DQ04_22481000 [Trypanosoma grayi]KEG05392.1 hypothetical protein DQ04_22481000 [Trypanosoma grayi]